MQKPIIKLYYKEGDPGSITSILEVEKSQREIWGQPELGLRKLLYKDFEKLSFPNGNDYTRVGTCVFHYYKGPFEEFQKILDYCTKGDIDVFEGFEVPISKGFPSEIL